MSTPLHRDRDNFPHLHKFQVSFATDNGRPVRAEVGDSVDGWTILRITRDEVRLERRGRHQFLPLTLR